MRNQLGCVMWMASVIVLTAAVGGCASAPHFRYYTIDMQPHAKVESAIRVGELRITVNQALSKPEILVRTSPTQIEYYALDRWASGLEEQVAEKLKTEFASVPKDLPALDFDGKLMAFEQVDTASGAEVRVKLEVASQDPRKAMGGFSPNFRKLYEKTQPAASPGATGAVEALSRATEAIALELGADLSDYLKTVSENQAQAKKK